LRGCRRGERLLAKGDRRFAGGFRVCLSARWRTAPARPLRSLPDRG
jgi:hypothetical protein